MRGASLAGAVLLAGVGLSLAADSAQPPLSRHEATRMSMACVYAIEAYGADAQALPRIVEEALRRGRSHRPADEPLQSREPAVARQPARPPTSRGRRSASSSTSSPSPCATAAIPSGAFDITVGPLMKAWGFFRGDGRMPSVDELSTARRHVGASACRSGSRRRDDRLRRARRRARSGRDRQRLRGRSRRPSAQRAARRRRRWSAPAAARSTGWVRRPGRRAGTSTIQDPLISTRVARTVRLKDRALSVAGGSEKYFEVAAAPLFAHHGPAHRQPGSRRPGRGRADEHRDGRRCARRRLFRAGASAESETDPTEPVDRSLLLHSRPESLVEDDSRSCALSGRTTPQPARNACVRPSGRLFSAYRHIRSRGSKGSRGSRVPGSRVLGFQPPEPELVNSRTSWNLWNPWNPGTSGTLGT